MNMKRKNLLALLLALAMVFALAACGSSSNTATSSDTTSTDAAGTDAADTDATDAADAAADAESEELPAQVQAIVDRGVLRVGVKSDVPGFGLQDVLTNEYSGLEIDLAYKIAETLGIDDVEFTAVTAATRGQLLDAGDIDMVAATFTITEERRSSWNFTTPYYTDAVSLLVKLDSGISDYADLTDKVVGVSTGSTSRDALIAAAAEAGVTLDSSANFSEFATYPEIKTALDAGRVDAFCVDGSILSGYLDDTVEILDSVRFSPQEYGIATKLDNTDWADYLDNLIVTWLADGTLDQMIADNGVAASFAG